MKKRQFKRILTSVFSVAILCPAVFMTSVINDTQMISAETNPHQNVSVDAEETTTPVESEERKDTQGEDISLVEDTLDSSVYYNANSDIRDFRDETIYFVMTTRFYDGDSSNNVHCWDGKAKNGEDTPWRGDFKGLIEKLDYIKALGFTALWITPIVKNASGYDYHGYHAINFKEVDSRYESDDCTYQDLIDAVHERGMKIIQDVVFNHTGNWGEENLYPMFQKDDNGDLSDVSCMLRNPDMEWDPNYDTFEPESERGTKQLRDRLKLMNADNEEPKKYDAEDIYHHNGFVGSSFEQPIVQYGSIHYADCMDLNTENPKVYKYLVDAYSQYIRMGVDAFRVDTVKHISRLTLNKAFVTQLNDVYNEVHGTTGEGNFYMFGEVCTRYRSVWNSGIPSISCPFYTWKETKDYAWDDSETSSAVETNCASAKQHYKDNSSNTGEQPTSKNVYLNGNEYHTPDYSQASGMNVIDFPMHWAFKSASEAYQQALDEDPYYNDSTFNVTYVDSHDYAPDNAPEGVRFNGSTETWAENLSLMFTFRGIPCIYYGSEVEFKKGAVIDKGPEIPLEESGRAYFGDLIEGSVDVVDFARYSNATGQMAETLKHPLSQHIQRLNRLRAAIPALRKGQYSTEGCKGSFAYKRRYTDATTDSFAVIALTSDASFSGLPNGKYTDAITGDVKNVTDGTLSTSGIRGQGDLRVYVLDTELTKAPGMIEGFSDYMSGGKEVLIDIVKPTGISLDKTSAKLDLGETVKLSATVAPANATNKSVSWTSSDPSVATVSSSGLVTGKSEGTATIYAATSNATQTDYDNKSGLVAVAEITVEATGVRVTSLTLSKTSVTLNGGEAVSIKTTILPPNASPSYAKVTWTSSDTSVAKVSQEGVISAVKKGKATITATTADGVSATVEVEVKGTVIYGNALYFEKPSGWGNSIKVHMWTDDERDLTTWPGMEMSLIDEEKGIYGIQWPEGESKINVVFNDGTNKTDDIKNVEMNSYYNKDGYVKEVPTVTEPDTSEEPSSSEDPTKPSEDPTEPSEDPTEPSEDPTEPSEDPTNPSEDPTNPSEDPTNPSEDPTNPSEDPTNPSEDPTNPSEDPTNPSEDPTNPSEDPTNPSEDPTNPSEDPTNPSEDPTNPSEDPTNPSEDPTNPSEDPTKPSEDPIEPIKNLEIKSFTVSVASRMIEKGKTVKLKASAKNATGTVKYRFTVKKDGITSIIRDYSTKSSTNWKPAKSGKYTLTVYVKDDYQVLKKSITNYVVNDPLKLTSFKISPKSKKAYAGKTVKLSVKATGGSKKYVYKFVYKTGSKTKTIAGYGSKKAVNWKPAKSGTYKLMAYVKDKATGKVVKKTVGKYIVKKK